MLTSTITAMASPYVFGGGGVLQDRTSLASSGIKGGAECAIDPLFASLAGGEVPSQVCLVGRSCGGLHSEGLTFN